MSKIINIRSFLIGIYLLVSYSHMLNAQDESFAFTVRFNPIYNQQDLIIDDEITADDLDSTDIHIDMMKCYVSKFRLYNKDQVVFEESNSYHLLDAEDKESLMLDFRLDHDVEFDRLDFVLGIDSTTSVSGAMGGDLDPTKGMFWTWNTGYIFFKLEGVSPISNERKNRFTYHIGGYDDPYKAYHSISFSIEKSNEIEVNIDLDQFVNQSLIRRLSSIMSPGNDALLLSQELTKIFKITR